MTFEILLCLSIALISGLLLSRLAKLVHLPAVTAYLVAGILVGPYLLGQLSSLVGVGGIGFTAIPTDTGFTSEFIEHFSILSDVALGFIAFSIGNEFRISQLKKIGKQATIVGIFQAVITTVVVDIALIALHFIMPKQFPIEAAIILGAIASATAPAATLMVVKQYKAKGPVTDILLPVVALDDAVGLILFAISFGIAKGIYSTNVDPVSIIVNPILEIVLSILLGALMGFLFSLCERFFHSRSKRLAVSVAFLFLTIAFTKIPFPPIGSVHIAFSPLLTCMMLGTVFCNVCDFSEELMDRVDRWAAPLFVVFFVTSGAELDLSVFTNWIIVVVGIVYIIFRSAGKYFGAFFSSKISSCDSNIVKYLGITLLPQAGVALGMSDMVKSSTEFGGTEIATIVTSITLFAVLIYELVGPFLTKIALTKAGDIKPEGKTSARVKNQPHRERHARHHH